MLTVFILQPPLEPGENQAGGGRGWRWRNPGDPLFAFRGFTRTLPRPFPPGCRQKGEHRPTASLQMEWVGRGLRWHQLVHTPQIKCQLAGPTGASWRSLKTVFPAVKAAALFCCLATFSPAGPPAAATQGSQNASNQRVKHPAAAQPPALLSQLSDVSSSKTPHMALRLLTIHPTDPRIFTSQRRRQEKICGP